MKSNDSKIDGRCAPGCVRFAHWLRSFYSLVAELKLLLLVLNVLKQASLMPQPVLALLGRNQ